MMIEREVTSQGCIPKVKRERNTVMMKVVSVRMTSMKTTPKKGCRRIMNITAKNSSKMRRANSRSKVMQK